MRILSENSGRWLTVTIATIIALAMAEIAVRFAPPDISVLGDMVLLVDEPITYRLKPNMDVTFSGLFETLPVPVRWQTNAQSIRRDSLVARTPAKPRIATFGDSETFGWSVSLEDSYQSYLERLSEHEVVNFGVPGYNTTNIALAMADLVPEFRPDTVIYLFNKNDFDLPIEVAATFFRSHLLGRFRFLWQIVVAKEERKRIRASQERKRVAADDLATMVDVSLTNQARLIVAFMHWQDWQDLKAFLPPDHPIIARLETGEVRVVNAEIALAGVPDLDDHLAPEAYQKLASLFCQTEIPCQKEEPGD